MDLVQLGESMLNESVGGERGPIQVSPAHTATGNVNLSHGAGRSRIQFVVKQVNSQVWDRYTDNAGAVSAVLLFQFAIGHVYGGLGYTVHIDQTGHLFTMPCKPCGQCRHVQRFTTKNNPT